MTEAKWLHHLKIAEPEGKADMIRLTEELLDVIKSGKVVAMACVLLKTDDDYSDCAITPCGTRIGIIGALSLLKQRIADNLLTEHDKT